MGKGCAVSIAGLGVSQHLVGIPHLNLDGVNIVVYPCEASSIGSRHQDRGSP